VREAASHNPNSMQRSLGSHASLAVAGLLGRTRIVPPTRIPSRGDPRVLPLVRFHRVLSPVAVEGRIADNSRMDARTPTQLRIEQLDPRVIKISRAKTPLERCAMAFAANQLVRERLQAPLRGAHPEWSEAEIAAEVARRVLRIKTTL